MGLANWLQFPVLAAKYPSGVFLQKNDSLSELGHREIVVFLVVEWLCYRFVTLGGVAFGEDYEFEFCQGGMLGSVTW